MVTRASDKCVTNPTNVARPPPQDQCHDVYVSDDLHVLLVHRMTQITHVSHLH